MAHDQSGTVTPHFVSHKDYESRHLVWDRQLGGDGAKGVFFTANALCRGIEALIMDVQYMYCFGALLASRSRQGEGLSASQASLQGLSGREYVVHTELLDNLDVICCCL